MMSSTRTRTIIRNTLLGLILLTALFGAIGYWLAPGWIKSAAEHGAEDALGRKLSIGAIHLSPYTLRIEVSDITLHEADGVGVAAHIGQVEAQLSPAALWKRALILDTLHVGAPELRIARLEAQRFSFSDIIEKILARPASAPLRFSVSNIRIDAGRIDFDDRVTRQQHRVEQIDIGLPFISNLPYVADIFIEPGFSARVDGSALRLKAKSKPWSPTLDTSLNLDLKGLDVPDWLSYAPLKLPLKVTSGKLDTTLELTFRRADAKVKDAMPEVNLSGKLALRDVAIQDEHGLREAIRGIDIVARDLSTSATRPANLSVDIQTARGETLTQRGEIWPLQRRATGQWSVSQLQPAQHAALLQRYAAPWFVGRIDSGALDGSGRYTLDLSGVQTGVRTDIKLTETSLLITTLSLRAPADKTALLTAGRIEVAGGAFDGKQLHLDSLRLSTPRVIARRDGAGRINLLDLLPARGKPAAAVAPAAAPAVAPAGAPALAIGIDAFDIDGGAVSFVDASPKRPVSIDASQLKLSLRTVSNDAGARMPFDFSGAIGKQGKLAARGNVALAPLSVQASIDATRVGLAFLQSYAGDYLNLSVASADLSTRGVLNLDLPKAAGAPRVRFKGNAEFANVATVDKVSATDFVRWKSLTLNNIDAQYPPQGAARDAPTGTPFALTVGAIGLSDFYARIIINANQRINLQEIINASGDDSQTASITTPTPANPSTTVATTTGKATTTIAALPPKSADAAPRPLIRLGNITLTGGNVNFTDNFIRPNYSANLTALNGSISSFATDSTEPAKVSIRGSVDGDGALDITARANPLARELYLDLAANATGIELTRLTPYATKYAGYPIEKGKLSMKVKYLIEHGKLEAQNSLFLDQLTFGAKVDGPDATKLPVLLAVALLKNSRGEIDIDLPISGSLSDPQFSMGGIIVKVIVNLLTRAITAPFSLLASAFGGGDELGYIEFAPGTALLTPAASAKLDTLAKALSERPALKLDIAGRVDPGTDTEGARRDKLATLVRAEKVKDLLREASASAGAALDPDQVTVDAADYPKYLERVYKAAKFAKPTNLIGLNKSLPVDEMEKLILANTAVGEDDLRKLAQARASAVRADLETRGKIAQARLFMVAPRLNADGIQGKGKPNRVDFALK